MTNIPSHEPPLTQEIVERFLVDTRPSDVQSPCPKPHTHPAPFLLSPNTRATNRA
ncbi:hypothetical protein NQZ68_013442, partial [Dissostichus eleginoides]